MKTIPFFCLIFAFVFMGNLIHSSTNNLSKIPFHVFSKYLSTYLTLDDLENVEILSRFFFELIKKDKDIERKNILTFFELIKKEKELENRSHLKIEDFPTKYFDIFQKRDWGRNGLEFVNVDFFPEEGFNLLNKNIRQILEFTNKRDSTNKHKYVLLKNGDLLFFVKNSGDDFFQVWYNGKQKTQLFYSKPNSHPIYKNNRCMEVGDTRNQSGGFFVYQFILYKNENMKRIIDYYENDKDRLCYFQCPKESKSILFLKNNNGYIENLTECVLHIFVKQESGFWNAYVRISHSCYGKKLKNADTLQDYQCDLKDLHFTLQSLL